MKTAKLRPTVKNRIKPALRRSCLVLSTVIMLAFGTAGGSTPANALTKCALRSYDASQALYDPCTECGSADQSANSGITAVSANASQVSIVKIIIGIAKTENLGQNGAVIGVMVGLTESSLHIEANSNIPLSQQDPLWLALPQPRPIGSDHNSVGVFQQQPDQGWSTFETGSAALTNKDAVFQDMDPAFSAEAFFGSPPGTNITGVKNPGALKKGLQNVSGWQSMSPAQAAQAVQRSAFDTGSNYQATLERAQSLVAQYWNTSAPVPLPIPFSGGTAAGSTNGSNADCSGQNGTVNCNATSDTSSAGLSQVRHDVVCIAQQELALWKSQPGYPHPAYAMDGYLKYTGGIRDLWCAWFVSWIYNQAHYPLKTGDPRVGFVPDIQAIGEKGQNFHWHPASSGYVPKPGDMAIHGAVHVNMFISASGNQATFIGGDQGDGPYPGGSIVSIEVDNGYYDSGITGYVSPD